MKRRPAAEPPPKPGSPRNPLREPRRGDLFKLMDGSLIRVGSASVTVAPDGAEIRCFAVEFVGLQSKHTHEVVTFGALRARLAGAEVLHSGPSVPDPWRIAPRNPAQPDEPPLR